jgi:uncharacterized membrane protein
MNRDIVLENFRKYFLYFVMYAMVGWIYEVFLELVIYQWGFSNRGVLFGPYLPIYGVGGVIFVVLFYRLSKKRSPSWIKFFAPLIIFLGCALVATGMELATSYILEYFTGAWPWQTYTDYSINFQGRIALSPSIRFGLGGLLFVYVLQPIFIKITGKLSKAKLIITSNILAAIVIIDLIYTMGVKDRIG